ncbi:ABC transporter permease subunit [Candidatus Poribacteria bacterium]|nr:ABC transporter permease subunit [Candidatus Poribacteria bacterium]
MPKKLRNIYINIRRNSGTILLLLPVLFVLFGYVLYPSIRVLWQSFRIKPGEITLDNYREFFNLGQRANLEALFNSLFISVGSVILSALVGVPLAFIFTRYRFPGRDIFASLAILPLVLPPLVGVISFMFLYGETGIIPRSIQSLFNLEKPPFAVDGVPAIFLVHTYTMYVFFYIFVSAALNKIDTSVIEAAYNLGASRWTVIRRIILPLLTPALVAASLLVFMTSMASFSAAFLFAPSYRVLSLQIYFSKVNNDLNMAATQSVILSFISISFLLIMRWYSGRRQYVIISKGVSAYETEIKGRLTRYIMGALGTLIVLILLLPHMTVILMSFVRDGSWTYQILPPEYTYKNYVKIFSNTRVLKPIVNSLKMASLATAGNLIFGVLAAYLLAKRRFFGRGLVDILVMIPWALPGTVVAMNLLFAFNRPTVFSANQIIASTFWILPLAYFVRNIPLVFRSTYASLQQLDDSLEESARNLGASRFYAFRKVIMPLVMPGVLAGVLLAFVTALGEFVASILLYIPTNKPISVEIYSQLDRLSNFGTASAYSVLLIILISTVLTFSNRVLKISTTRSMV